MAYDWSLLRSLVANCSRKHDFTFSHLSPFDLQEHPAKPHLFSEPPSTSHGVSTAGKPLWGSEVKLALMEGSEKGPFLEMKTNSVGEKLPVI